MTEREKWKKERKTVNWHVPEHQGKSLNPKGNALDRPLLLCASRSWQRSNCQSWDCWQLTQFLSWLSSVCHKKTGCFSNNDYNNYNKTTGHIPSPATVAVQLLSFVSFRMGRDSITEHLFNKKSKLLMKWLVPHNIMIFVGKCAYPPCRQSTTPPECLVRPASSLRSSAPNPKHPPCHPWNLIRWQCYWQRQQKKSINDQSSKTNKHFRKKNSECEW